MKTAYKIAIIAAIAATQGAYAQKKDENIGTEVVNVVKPYTPTISDAFKVKETPVIEDEENSTKKEIQYNIFSYPVASTFSPAKGRAAAVDKEAREKYFNNYATLGLGNYGTINGEIFVTQNLDDGQYVGGLLRHLSSQGGIEGVKLDNNYSNTGIDLTYGNRQKEYTWSTDLGFQHQGYNWYGLDYSLFDENATSTDLDVKQTYNTAYVGGKLTMRDGFFHEAQAQYKRFWDGFNSAENRFFITPSFDIDISETKVKFDVVADYVGGDFDHYYFAQDAITYSNFNLGIQPSIQYQNKDLAVQFGAGVFYSMGKQNEESKNKVYIYPQVKGSFKVVGDLMVAYAGAEGTLKQNSYADFAGQNPFVSPTLTVAPTNQQYDIYVGLKGKLASAISYNLRGSYMNEDDRAFFAANNPLEIATGATSLKGYQYGNSFTLLYDNLKTVSFFGELKADFSNTVRFGINGTYFNYTTDQAEAWNLPSIKVGANLDVDITEKWYAGTNIFFVGDRKDRIFTVSSPDPAFYDQQVVTLKSYFDVNANVGYHYNDRLTGFIKLNNITGQNYQKWLYYPVQGFQFMLGATYKFNL
ncbi:TonB-dependent receptor [Flavobacterium sp. RHBU_24]|uniref:TonB-dependent receptor n=1 Tax=Flavobacterium sp. RHBU_24 TaxID=3391185 RepID=UPI003984D958